jgi:hypothetical protein
MLVLVRLAISLISQCVGSLLLYGFISATQTYYIVVTESPHETSQKNIIAGFWMQQEAKRSQKKHKVTTQELLRGAAFDVDVLWSRPARGLSKMIFVVLYLSLTVRERWP